MKTPYVVLIELLFTPYFEFHDRKMAALGTAASKYVNLFVEMGDEHTLTYLYSKDTKYGRSALPGGDTLTMKPKPARPCCELKDKHFDVPIEELIKTEPGIRQIAKDAMYYRENWTLDEGTKKFHAGKGLFIWFIEQLGYTGEAADDEAIDAFR